MRTRLCANCNHFHDPKTYGPAGPQHAPQKGECRRYAPRPASVYRESELNWPPRMSNEWCGEWKPREDTPCAAE